MLNSWPLFSHDLLQSCMKELSWSFGRLSVALRTISLHCQTVVSRKRQTKPETEGPRYLKTRCRTITRPQLHSQDRARQRTARIKRRTEKATQARDLLIITSELGNIQRSRLWIIKRTYEGNINVTAVYTLPQEMRIASIMVETSHVTLTL